MTVYQGFLRSLLIGIFLSFIAPILLIITILTSFICLGWLPGLTSIAMAAIAQIKQFLATFGNGCPFEGLLVISSTCSVVGAMFDTYAFYRYQALRGN